jgi:tellurite resistance protein TerC
MDVALALAAGTAVVAGLVLEARMFARGHSPGRDQAIAWAIGWTVASLAAGAVIAAAGGPAGAWTTVYLIERSLSLDNVFLFSVLLASFAVPPELRIRVVAIGIAGALVVRGVAITIGIAVIDAVEPVVYVFGVLLLLVAFRTYRGSDETRDPADGRVLRVVRRAVPTTDDFRGRRFLVREEGRVYATPLLLTAVALVAVDIAFAVDSIPAALAVTRNPAVIWTANGFALLGLGALLELVDLLVKRFRYLDKTIAVVLTFVGLRILLADAVDVSDAASLAIIAGLVAGGAVLSVAADRWRPVAPAQRERRRPPRCGPNLPQLAEEPRA